jgi:MarR family transcriptional regulator, transcriptional regulator for hemolysin
MDAPAPDESALTLWPRTGSGAVPSMGEIGLNHFAPYLINRISAGWNARLAATLAGFGLSTTQMRALAVLSIMPGITVKELALAAVTEQSTLSRTLDALDEQGLIRRSPKPGDARVREVFITERGQALFAEIWPTLYDHYARLFEGVGAADFRAFLGTAHRLLRNLEGPRDDAPRG